MVLNCPSSPLSLASGLPPQVVRSSGRIAREIPILLIGSDLGGKVFSEPTSTVLLSLHGAGVLSRHKLSPEQELVLRWPERNKETEIRVVGQVGSQNGHHTYGVAFFDQTLNFWEIDFPPVTAAQRELGLLSLVCTHCKTLEKVDDSSPEADVCATNEGVLRFCKRCGSATLWKPATGGVAQDSATPNDPAAGSAQLALFSSPTPAAPSPASQNSAQPSAPSPSAVLTMSPPAELKPAAPPVNRRKHPRVKVDYSACVRVPGRADDVVQCEDMSKGGLRFKSRQRYYAQSLIEVAVPYQSGQPAIFVPAQIVFVEELPEQRLFRCGVQYLKAIKPRDYL
jgi:PilZ domain-containing protein